MPSGRSCREPDRRATGQAGRAHGGSQPARTDGNYLLALVITAAHRCGSDDRRHRALVERDAGDLGQHRRLPGLVAEAGLAAPGLARVGMVLAVAAIAERPVVAEPPTADAHEQATPASP